LRLLDAPFHFDKKEINNYAGKGTTLPFNGWDFVVSVDLFGRS
jgi:hypothetical protein